MGKVRGSREECHGDCALCGSPYENWGNNPMPLLASADYRVCDDCNQYVIAVRLGVIKLPWLEKSK